MNLTFSTLASPAWTLDQIIDAAVANGISGIDFRGIGPELDITQLPAFTTDLPATMQKLRDRKLQMPCLNSSITLVTTDAAKWDSMLGECRRYSDLAKKTGTKFLRVFGGAIPEGMTRNDARDLGRQHLRELCEIANPNGCRPLLETHDAWIFSHHIMNLIAHFDPEEAGVLWDLEHPWRGGECAEDVAAALNDRIQHIHIKDTIRKDGNSAPTLLGEGEIPLGECFTALKQIGYAGWICLETEKRWHPEGPDPEVSIPQFVKYMQNHAS
jgi:sugar phosphate isomerase/epimerase